MSRSKELRIHILNVGHGDNIIIEFPRSSADPLIGIVDCFKAKKTLDYLHKLGAKEIAFVCATHPHRDHIRGIPKLLHAYEGRIQRFWDCGFPHSSKTYRQVLEFI